MNRNLKLWLVCAVMVVLGSLPRIAYAQLYDLVVAKDGTGDFATVQEAIYAVRDYKPEGRQRILIKKGVYEEKVWIPTWKTNLTLVGEDRDSTIIVWHDHANIKDSKGHKIGTFESWTLKAEGPGFEAENLTLVNDAMTYHNPGYRKQGNVYDPNFLAEGQNKAGVGQAVTVHVEADRAVFRNCRFFGFQDTIFNGNEDSRQLFVDCYIEGTVDFIFGPATCWFEHCHLHALSKGYLTAASTPGHHPYGYVFNRCEVTCADNVQNEYLGRPWRNYAAVIFMNTNMCGQIHPQGWHNWRDPAREKTARYVEINCTGPGADRSNRVAWSQDWSNRSLDITPAKVFATGAQPWNPVIYAPDFRTCIDQYLKAYEPRYVAGYLDAYPVAKDASTPEPLRLSADSVDCTTWVENVLAMQLSGGVIPSLNDSISRRYVQALRYRGGKRGNYASRLHYFSDWMANKEQQGIMEEVTMRLKGATTQRKTINFMSQHPTSYPHLAGNDSLLKAIEKVEQRLSSQAMPLLPKQKLAAAACDLQEGDVIALVTDIEGLDIMHVGFVTWVDAKPYLLHASSTAGKVVKVPLVDYVKQSKRCKGVRVMRMKA